MPKVHRLPELHGVDPASNVCRWRTLGLFLDLDKVLETVSLLEKLGLRSSDILILTKNPSSSLPPVNWTPVTWGVQGLGLGLGLGLLVGLGGFFLSGAILGSLVTVLLGLGGAWLGWRLGIKQPRSFLKPFWRDVQQGSYLVLIYGTQSAHQRVLHPVRGTVGNLYETRELVA
ncbi:hypothetical protein [Anthocerotibacter panamensis]|uniref:hypothetical protein n=1 Tax=Anthocerotibacter panamensis TaxID=2857077 RepID=UPI001C403157|nr:hypothetical protein [Anthocerotibacter panamensis]